MVKIVTESTADIPPDVAAALGISVIPAYVVFGLETFRDGVELSMDEFYEKLATTQLIPTTATPPPLVYTDVYRRLGQETDGIVSIHLAANLSALHRVATQAAREVPGIKIVNIDSEQLTMGYGWMAIAAAEAAQQGASLDEVVALVEDMKHRSHVFAVLDTLEFVHRGGRVSWGAALIGTLMRIKPIIEVKDSEVKLVERARTAARAMDRLLDLVRVMGPLERAVVLHTNAPQRAEEVADRVQAIHPEWTRMIAPAGVTIASHAGPGAVGIACVTV